MPALLRWIQAGTLVTGSVLLIYFAAGKIDRSAGRDPEPSALEAAREGLDPARAPEVDQSLWSEGRIVKYQESLGQSFAPPLAVLRIPRAGLEVPVLPGTDEPTLNRAVGHIAGTAVPGETGNVGIAGHRDGYFRGLEDLQIEDRLELETLSGTQAYRVTSIRIVDPTAVEVLAPTLQPAVTLVTCYPFYFVGKAPQRFIVRAEALPAGLPSTAANLAHVGIAGLAFVLVGAAIGGWRRRLT